MSVEEPEGYHYEWRPDPAFEIGGEGRKCRMKRCPEMAVAKLWRRGFRRNGWWHYCAAHLYGRKIEDGVVKSRILVRNEEEVA